MVGIHLRSVHNFPHCVWSNQVWGELEWGFQRRGTEKRLKAGKSGTPPLQNKIARIGRENLRRGNPPDITWMCFEIRTGQSGQALLQSAGSKDSIALGDVQRTILRLRRSTSRATGSGCSPRRHFQTLCYSMGRYGSPLADRAEMRNRKRGSRIS